jgi:hypothetical protein
MSSVESIIKKRLEAFDQEIMAGLTQNHIPVIISMISKELGVENVAATIDPSKRLVIISVYDKEWKHPVLIKESKNMTYRLGCLRLFLGIPLWTLRFQTKEDKTNG